MSQIFISHVEEDADVALELARGLEAAGYTTWYYERDSQPAVSYLLQTGQAVDTAEAVLVVVSPASIKSPHQMDREVVRALETDKHFVPVLRGINHAEFQTRQPTWRQAADNPVP